MGVRALAALARRLNREAGEPHIPSLYFFTDPERMPDPIQIAERLPHGTAVVYRHFGAANRRRIARQLATVCRSRRLVLLIAADPNLAADVGAAGVHWPEKRLPERRDADMPLVTAAAHSLSAARNAAASGVDVCVLAPIFASRSNSGNRALGLFRASQIARAAPIPVIALGGIGEREAKRLPGRGFAGLAAIEAFLET